MAPDNSNMNDGKKGLGIGLGMFKRYTTIDNLQYCLLGCWNMCFLESVLAQSSMYFTQVLFFPSL